MKRRRRYRIVNILVLLVAVLFGINYYGSEKCLGGGEKIAVLVLAAAAVHSIKIFRLYFALYGKGVSSGQHLRQYCKTITVNMIIPLKMGDIFRAYCYGYKMQNYFGGAALIVFDRFTDTLALVTMILAVQMVWALKIMPLLYILLIILMFLCSCYLVFPGMYQYWNKYFLKLSASKNRNSILRMLEYFNYAYKELVITIKGRGILLYILSLAAWAVEIYGLFLSNGISAGNQAEHKVSDYLMSALTGIPSVYMEQFVLVSILLLAVIYLFLHMVYLTDLFLLLEDFLF